jgi:hypothetical protein
MFGFTLTLNLNLHSGSGSVIWLNRTSNIMFGSGSNNVREVRNRTAASLVLRMKWKYALAGGHCEAHKTHAGSRQVRFETKGMTERNKERLGCKTFIGSFYI